MRNTNFKLGLFWFALIISPVLATDTFSHPLGVTITPPAGWARMNGLELSQFNSLARESNDAGYYLTPAGAQQPNAIVLVQIFQGPPIRFSDWESLEASMKKDISEKLKKESRLPFQESVKMVGFYNDRKANRVFVELHESGPDGGNRLVCLQICSRGFCRIHCIPREGNLSAHEAQFNEFINRIQVAPGAKFELEKRSLPISLPNPTVLIAIGIGVVILVVLVAVVVVVILVTQTTRSKSRSRRPPNRSRRPIRR